VTTGPESERKRNKRHHQRTLFNNIAERYEVSRPGYPPHVVEFITTTAGLAAARRRLAGAEVSFQVTTPAAPGRDGRPDPGNLPR
jgi:hypothetical protein